MNRVASIKKSYRVVTYLFLTVVAYFTSVLLVTFFDRYSMTSIEVPTVHGDTSHACIRTTGNGDDAGNSDSGGPGCG